MAAILIARDVKKSYTSGARTETVLTSVSFTIDAGRFACIMGPSGSGKSTLLHIVSGLEPPTSGLVLLDQQDVFALAERDRTLLRRSLVGFVFQFFNLIPNLSVRENIDLPLMMQGRERPGEDLHRKSVVELLGLAQKQDAMPHQLSGGEMQRTSIARAIVHKPRIVMADEPTGNLSSKAGREVMQLLRSSCDRFGQTILLVTHNPRDAAFADEVRFLKDGVLSADVHLKKGEVNETRVLEALEHLQI
ncbi:MAG: ABC transporter ATP-binding protein [Planctomycetota bacterium]